MLKRIAQLSLILLACTLFTGPATPRVMAWHVGESAGQHTADGIRTLYEGEGEDRQERALAAFKAAVELEPLTAEYRLNLAYAYDQCREAAIDKYGWDHATLFDQIAREFAAARALDPDDIAIALTYANHLLMAEDFGLEPRSDQAFAAWRHCLALQDREIERNSLMSPRMTRVGILVHLGRIELERGRDQEAVQYFRLAANSYFGSELAQKFLEELDEAIPHSIDQGA